MPHLCGGIWQDEHGTCRIPTLYVSSYFGVFLLCYHRDLVDGGLLCLPERPVLELVPIRNLLLTL
jgi:hypothetical protein